MRIVVVSIISSSHRHDYCAIIIVLADVAGDTFKFLLKKKLLVVKEKRFLGMIKTEKKWLRSLQLRDVASAFEHKLILK